MTAQEEIQEITSGYLKALGELTEESGYTENWPRLIAKILLIQTTASVVMMGTAMEMMASARDYIDAKER